MKTLLDFFNRIDEYYAYLTAKGQTFTSDGWPLIDKNCFLTDIPDIMVPFYKRRDKRVQKFSSIAICSFSSDKDIYPRLDKVLEDIEEYKKYAAVVAADLTVTEDMDVEWQRVTMLMNQLFMSILAINGIKVIANTRTGSSQMVVCLRNIPRDVMYASGFLGCPKTLEFNYDYIAKILALRPSMLLIYGKCSVTDRDKLSRMGIKFKVYDDYRTLNKKWRKSNVGC